MFFAFYAIKVYKQMREQTTTVANGRKGYPFVYFWTPMQTGSQLVGVAVRELKSRQNVTRKTANLELIGNLIFLNDILNSMIQLHVE